MAVMSYRSLLLNFQAQFLIGILTHNTLFIYLLLSLLTPTIPFYRAACNADAVL